MASKSSYTLIRGRRMRVTRLDNCGRPIYGDESQAVTDGFVSVGFTAQTTEAEPIEITNAGGKICARDPGTPQFNGYDLEITFCGVEPCLLEILTGQPPVTDVNGDTVGFRMNSGIDQSTQAFALEIWAGVPGVACSDTGDGSYGYILVPFVSSGVIGDFTVENNAINFVVSGASTKDGNGWGAGPYEVAPDASGAPSRLPERLDTDDHLYVIWTSVKPPEPTNGCTTLEAPDPIPVTGVTGGTPGSFAPANADIPANLAALKGDTAVGDTGTNKPGAAWTVGQYVVLGDASEAYWDGTAWAAGRTPAALVARKAKASASS